MTPAVLAALWEARVQAAEGVAMGAVKEMGEEALRISKATMEELIYAHPIPTTRQGKPRWKRTRNLIMRERVVFRTTPPTATLINKVRYAEIRHEMGKPERKGTHWPAHWRDIVRGEIRQRFTPLLQSRLQSILAGTSGQFIKGGP